MNKEICAGINFTVGDCWYKNTVTISADDDFANSNGELKLQNNNNYLYIPIFFPAVHTFNTLVLKLAIRQFTLQKYFSFFVMF